LVQAVPRDVSSNQSGIIYAQGYKMEEIESQLSAAEAAKINVSWPFIKGTRLEKRESACIGQKVCGSTQSCREDGKQKFLGI
ncbi:hypothetical protein Tco_0860891, partial [Tanacetum coccineum]